MGARAWALLGRTNAGPIAVVVLAIVGVWYAGAVKLNAPRLLDQYDSQPPARGRPVESQADKDRFQLRLQDRVFAVPENGIPVVAVRPGVRC